MKEMQPALKKDLERLYDSYDVVSDEIVGLEKTIKDRQRFRGNIKSRIMSFEEHLISMGVEVKSEFM